MLTPMGPGVDSDTATMSASISCVNQPVRVEISYMNGSVAIPPPTAKRPVLKNS